MKSRAQYKYNTLLMNARTSLVTKYCYNTLQQKNIVASMIALLAMLLIITPVSANTSNWNFTSFMDGRYLNGSDNVVFHQIDAGFLTFEGSIAAVDSNENPNPNASEWTFQVKKDAFGPDPTICQTVVLPTTDGNPVFFNEGCENTSAGSYCLVIFRGASDGCSYSGSGTLEM